MSILRYKRIFEPIQLGRTLFRNRIFSSPQDIYRLTAENFLDEDATAFYEMKAMGGFASVCLGDFMIDSRSAHSHPFQLRGDDPRGRTSLTRTASAITRHNAVAAVELNHAGKNGNIMGRREGFIYGPDDGTRADGIEIRAMDEAWIEYLIGRYAAAAALARQCGFGMITVHAGHGWLPAQFISPRDNHRRDRWGGSFENRMRFTLAVIEAVRRAVGPATPIEIRLSAVECVPGGYDLDEGIAVAKALDGKVDLLHVSAGHHEEDAASMVSHPTMFAPDGANVKYAAEVKKHVKTPVATVGALCDPAQLEEILASGQADVVALGRQTLADPFFPLKARTGREDEINQCLRCMSCFSMNTLSGVFYCATNPVIGHEREALCEAPARERKRVLVAGGGVAGMQAALTASERGHTVILCEKSGRLGGALLCEAHIPFKRKLDLYLKRQALRVSRAPIELRLNTEVTPALARELAPDVIVAALGARPVIPAIKGIDGPNVVLAEDVYLDPAKAGKRVVIIGGGLVGLELGIFLAQNGRSVTVVEMLPDTIATRKELPVSERIGGALALEVGTNIVHGVALAQEIKKLPNLRILASTKVPEIDEAGCFAEDATGVRKLEADTVICAVGQRPLREEGAALHDCAPEFYQIGDCLAARNILTATQTADRIARDIGR
ncbi:MAG: FAD-dependent oxidoreductase [Clostridiales Family XIII bacterium]|jgi:2,4-dienoyl-CoA reductase-like NADH-dependent reductase (Old Yellow Enzyme family)/threonine dehydrogenase-like Zn-dependent dehydrogenase|nr:FAD-dependent oxidoreductase [Clostridiales Family XIII bacterium]